MMLNKIDNKMITIKIKQINISIIIIDILKKLLTNIKMRLLIKKLNSINKLKYYQIELL